jgi:hypothetical protein
MTNKLKLTLLGATLGAFLLPAASQTSSAPQQTGTTPAQATAPVKNDRPETINQRKENQQDRITQGIGSGSLTTGEASTLEKQETDLNKEETNMRKLDNGKLTAADRAVLQQQQNQLSKEIYTDKHNSTAQKENMKSKEGKREEHQQARIAQGVNSGQLTSTEAANLEGKENAINKEVSQDRKANGGHMTAAERAQVNRQQNQLSKQIYKDKHNNRRQGH